MKKKFKPLILFTTALLFSFSSCTGENLVPALPDAPEYKTISLHITQQQPTTRGVSRPIPNGELLEFNSGDLYLVSEQGLVIRHFRLERGAATVNGVINIDNEIGDFDNTGRIETLTIENVPGHVRRVYIIGNTEDNPTGGFINSIGERIINIVSQHNAWNVNLFGSTNLVYATTLPDGTQVWRNPTNAPLYLAPTVARFEISSITGTGSIESFDVVGIFMDNFFSRAHINGEIDKNSLWSRTTAGYFTDTGTFFVNDTYNALHDSSISGLGVRNGSTVTPGYTDNFPEFVDNTTTPYRQGVWAYQVFAPQNRNDLDANQQPRIVLRLRNINKIGATTPLNGDRFVTIRSFFNFEGIQAGTVYRLAIEFDEQDLAYCPNVSTPLVEGGAFVGAFWRNYQRGERLIRMPYSGTWYAYVPDNYNDWIQLDREMSWPMGYEYLVCMTTQDNLHRLADDAGYRVNGTGSIYFRIGLRSYNTNPTNSAHRTPEGGVGRQPRYGRVIVVYNNGLNRHTIWVRQGEDTDYLMRVSDAGGADAQRTAARIRTFSPFNLRAEALNAQVSTRAQQVAGTATNRSTFVRYPTQTGAFFQWAHPGTIMRYAWNPVEPAGGPANWTINTASGNWYTNATTPNLMTSHEACPPGFRRPRDGDPWGATTRLNNTAADVHGSEMRQSLFLNPPRGHSVDLANSVWGFYADGFFDRRVPTTPTGGVTSRAFASTVGANTEYIAHRGRLFFNAASGASLFFPATGIRSTTVSGAPYLVGDFTLYLSSTQGDAAAHVWRLQLNHNTARMDGSNTRAHGFAVRCVAE